MINDEDQIKLVLSLLETIRNELDSGCTYTERKLARTLSNGIIVSTAWTPDAGWETALIGAGTPALIGGYEGRGEVVIVQRYADATEAEAGHEAWIAECAKSSSPSMEVRALVNLMRLTETQAAKLV